jgi:hypothetical protein
VYCATYCTNLSVKPPNFVVEADASRGEEFTSSAHFEFVIVSGWLTILAVSFNYGE